MVLFDFGNVIARFENSCFIARLTGRPQEEVGDLTRRVFKVSCFPTLFETGRITSEEFKQGIEEILQKKFDQKFFEAAYCEIFQNIPETQDLIKFLVGKTRIGMLSNTNSLHFEKVISKIPEFEKFDQITLSFQIGVMKPSPEIYLDAIRKSGFSPKDILYLDDVKAFVEGGSQAGLNAILFDDPAKVSDRVKKFFT